MFIHFHCRTTKPQKPKLADVSDALRDQVVQIVQTSRTLNRRSKTAVAFAFGIVKTPEVGT